MTAGTHGRSTLAKIAEKEDALAELKVRVLKGEISMTAYYVAAQPIARDLSSLRSESESSES